MVQINNMTTESEQFEKAAHAQLVQQKTDKLLAYMDKLIAEMDQAYALHRRDGLICFFMFLTYFTVILAKVVMPGVWMDVTKSVAEAVFWFTLGWSWIYVTPRFIGCLDEFRGCVKTLRILGYIDEREDGDTIKKYKESWMAKLWEVMKQKARSDAYQAA